MNSMLATVFYGPPNWIVRKFNAEDRRAFGFWVLIGSGIGAVFYGTKVLYVSIVSWFALIPNFTTETPVEEEGE